MPRKKVVRVYLPPQMAEVVERINRDFGISEKEILRWAFREFADLGYFSGSLDPVELSDRFIKSSKDRATIQALTETKDESLIDWRVYAEIGISDQDVLDFLVKYALKNGNPKSKRVPGLPLGNLLRQLPA